MMNAHNLDFAAAVSLINSSQRVLLVSHKRPDGDTLGAASALYTLLMSLGKRATLACIDEIPRRLRFIPHTELFVRDFDLSHFDLIIISDAGASHMTGFQEKYPDLLSKKIPLINIDHHISNDGFGTVNLVDPAASSATVVVWRLIKYCNGPLTKDSAIALMAGVYNDTGGFMHSNTNAETFQMASEVTAVGISISDIVSPLFKQTTANQLRLWGYILEHMKKNEEAVLSSVITASDFKTIGAHGSETGGIVDLMNTVPDASFVLLLAEDEGWVKGSLRTQRDDIDLSDLAGQFGGGGHRKASGFRLQGHLEKEVVWKIVPSKVK